MWSNLWSVLLVTLDLYRFEMLFADYAHLRKARVFVIIYILEPAFRSINV